jgi:hypothetical protein
VSETDPTETDPTPGDPAAEGVDHLQRAAREVVAAARSFLDAIEHVVEDREALREVSSTVAGLAATVGDAIGDAVRGRPAPWVDAAWRSDDGSPSDSTPGSAAAPDAAARGEAARDPGAVPVIEVAAPADDPAEPRIDLGDDDTEDWARPLVDPEAPRRPSRVRRIAVD